MHQLLTVKEGGGELYAAQGWVHSGRLRRLHINWVFQVHSMKCIKCLKSNCMKLMYTKLKCLMFKCIENVHRMPEIEMEGMHAHRAAVCRHLELNSKSGKSAQAMHELKT